MTRPMRAARERLFKEQKGLCYYCETPMLLQHGSQTKRSATIDHIIPKSQGGSIGPTLNGVAACLACNRERGDKDARLFLLGKRGLL